MSCQLWKPVLFDFARGIESEQTREALSHARECRNCALILDQQQLLTELLRSAAAAPNQEFNKVPENLMSVFRANRVSKSPQSISWLRAAIFVLLMLGGWMWYRTHHFEIPKTAASQHDDGEFIPLQYAGNPSNSFQVVRVELGSSDLQQLGFPGVPEWAENRSVKADIVVGEDGLPHAIRFVTAEMQR
jgi:hypothetical protein